MGSNQANVTSVDALDALRASLIIFQGKARRALDDATDELRRTRMWLQHEQRTRWENELKKRNRALDQAEQDLISAKLSSLRDNITFQQNAVRKAKAAVAEAEEKLRMIRKWNQNFDAMADPMAKRLEGLRQFLDYNLPKGVTYLVHAAQTLEAYAEVHEPKSAPSEAPATSSEAPPA
ncbi:MAG TPA: hypothetical protein VK961_10585 [Chthoniobacter sp.]|nr:hypothetical protein [Chthoniobacter sp.]